MSTTSTSPLDVIVVGGGIVGLAVAWRAAQQGRRTLVLHRPSRPGEATAVAAGMVAPVAEAQFGEGALLELSLQGARRWPDFARELEAASGRDPGYRRSGTLLVARDRDEAEELERELTFRTELGIEVTRLRPREARRLEPALAPTLRLALSVPDDHAVDPRRVAVALRAAALAAGAQVREGEVADLLTRGDRVTGVALAGGEMLAAERVVVAAGAWSGALAPVPVRPVKGQILRLRDPSGPGLVERVVRMPGAYLVPRDDGRYVLGATVEEQGFDTAVTAGGIFTLLRDASEAVPGVLELEIEEASVGLRPGTPDNLPVLGAGQPAGLLWATGHHRNGVLLAPVTADLLAAELAGVPDPRAAAFSPARFSPVAVAA